ncbi:hypothetical protein [Acinetobacter variabilis]|uniref:Uncharacterized protein n=1 Tax=Acinetobacter variabilis TaxID=70346 RepID=N8WWS1_9GAMM|nr:hypothetical protein [Acinetobacter variabilis]ENU99359.1 hypothetical protein F969_01678 [Acinetobacter variabilis]
MPKMSAIVYDPPSNEFPHLAVIFNDQGEVIVSIPCASITEGESFIEQALKDFTVETKVIK